MTIMNCKFGGTYWFFWTTLISHFNFNGLLLQLWENWINENSNMQWRLRQPFYTQWTCLSYMAWIVLIHLRCFHTLQGLCCFDSLALHCFDTLNHSSCFNTLGLFWYNCIVLICWGCFDTLALFWYIANNPFPSTWAITHMSRVQFSWVQIFSHI